MTGYAVCSTFNCWYFAVKKRRNSKRDGVILKAFEKYLNIGSGTTHTDILKEDSVLLSVASEEKEKNAHS